MMDLDDNPNVNYLLIAGAVYLTFLLIAISINPVIGVSLFLFSSAVGCVAAIIYIIRRQVEQRARPQVHGFGPRCRDRIAECRRQEDKFRDEANTIRRNITSLQEDLERSTTAPRQDIERAENTVKALKAEFDLRHTKALFFADCATRLEQLLRRHRLNENIKQRQQELEQLRTTNLNDEATVEETRHFLEQDSNQLEALTKINREVSEYFKTEHAEELRDRMDKLRSKILDRGKDQTSPASPIDEKKS